MEKSEYIEKAPYYYALAIAVALRNGENVKTQREIEQYFASVRTVFAHAPLFREAIAILKKHNNIIIVHDDFGPNVIDTNDSFLSWFGSKQFNEVPLFKKFNVMKLSQNWLLNAINEVNKQYISLGFSSADFQEAIVETDWEPIPIDRESPEVEKVETELDAAIEAIEGDNGYAVHHPAERDYALSQLKQFRKMLKTEAQIALLYVKNFAIDPLNRVIKRMGEAATGMAAAAARQAIVGWLKSLIGKAADWIS
ncbi:MAG: hypothetical protein AAGF48_07770 [Pseudomonadota bacterium]